MNLAAHLPQDRIGWYSWLVVLCFASVFLASSQSAASIPTYLLALVVVGSVVHWNDLFRLPFSWLLVALLVYLTASSLWSKPFDASSTISIVIRGLLVFCFVVAWAECQLRGRPQQALTVTLTLAGSGFALVSLANFFLYPPLDGRLNGLGQLDTHVIAALVFGVVLILLLQQMHRALGLWTRLGLAILFCTVAVAIGLSDSRNAWVSVAIGVLVFLVSEHVKDVSRFLVAVVAAASVLSFVLLSLAMSPDTVDSVLPRGDSFRPAIWMATLDSMHGLDWVFGRGISTNDDLLIGGIVFKHPHNMYLAVLHQGGIIGLLLFVALIVVTLRVLLANYDAPSAKLAIGLLALALTSYLLDGHELVDKISDTWFLFWWPVAIALGLDWGKPARTLHV